MFTSPDAAPVQGSNDQLLMVTEVFLSFMPSQEQALQLWQVANRIKDDIQTLMPFQEQMLHLWQVANELKEVIYILTLPSALQLVQVANSIKKVI